MQSVHVHSLSLYKFWYIKMYQHVCSSRSEKKFGWELQFLILKCCNLQHTKSWFSFRLRYTSSKICARFSLINLISLIHSLEFLVLKNFSVIFSRCHHFTCFRNSFMHPSYPISKVTRFVNRYKFGLSCEYNTIHFPGPLRVLKR